MSAYGVDPYGRPAQQRAQANNPYQQSPQANPSVAQPQQPGDQANGQTALYAPAHPANQQERSYVPPNGNTGIGGAVTEGIQAAQNVSPQGPQNGNYQEYVLGQLRGKSGMTSEQALRDLAPTFQQNGINTQIASDGTARGRIFLPNGEMVTLVGDGQGWGQGDWAWRTGNSQFGSGGGGGETQIQGPGLMSAPPAVSGVQLPRTVLPTTALPTYTGYNFDDQSGVNSGQTALLNQLLANPHSMNDAGVGALKQKQMEDAMSMKDQLAQQLAQQYAGRGTMGGGGFASQNQRLGTSMAGDILNSNRDIDIARMQQDRTDELGVLGASGNYMQGQLAQQLAQAGENHTAFGSRSDAVKFALDQALAQGNLDNAFQNRQNQNDQFYASLGQNNNQFNASQTLSQLLAMAQLNFQYQNAALNSNNSNNPWASY